MLYNEFNPINAIALEEAARRITQFNSKYNISIIMEKLGDSDSYKIIKSGKIEVTVLIRFFKNKLL